MPSAGILARHWRRILFLAAAFKSWRRKPACAIGTRWGGGMRSNHCRLTLYSALILLGFCLPAIAGPEEDLAQLNALRQQLEGAKAEVAQSVGLAQQALDDAAPAAKEHKIYVSEQTPIEAQAAEIKRQVDAVTANTNKHDQVVEQHNANCAGTSTDAAYVARCNGEAAQLNAWKDRLDTEKRSISEAAKPIQSILERDAALVERINSDQQQYMEASQQAEDAQARAQALAQKSWTRYWCASN